MIRRRFMSDSLEDNVIFTYYAPNKCPFLGGVNTKNLYINTYNNELIKCTLIEDSYNNNIGTYKFNIKDITNIDFTNGFYIFENNTSESPIIIGTFFDYIDTRNSYTPIHNEITNFIYPNNITKIFGNMSILEAPNVESITLPENLLELYATTIYTGVFFYCNNIKSITIPKNVIKIDTITQLSNNNNLKEIVIKPLIPPTVVNDGHIFGDIPENINNDFKIKVYPDVISYYQSVEKWKEYFNFYEPINGIIVYNNSCKCSSSLPSIEHNYDNDLKRGEYLFNNDTILTLEKNSSIFNVENLYITTECNIINGQPFSLNRQLKNVYIKTSKYDSRENCNCIINTNTNYLVLAGENMHIPDTVIGIENYAIAITNLITTVNIPINIKYINGYAFKESSFKSLSITANDDLSIYDVSYNAICNIYLSNCNIREHVFISESKYYYSSYYNYDYSNCGIVRKSDNSLIKAGCKDSIGPHVTNIQGAFAYNIELTRITIPDNVLKIEGAFLQCTNLEYITMSNNITSIGNYSFTNCKKLHVEDAITDSVKYIGIDAFAGCQCDTFDTKNIESIDTISDSLFANTLIIRKSLKEFKGDVLINTNILVVDDESEYFKNENNCLIRKSDNALILLVNGTNTIIEGVEKLCSYSCRFANTELHIPNTIKVIENSAFAGKYFNIHYNGTLSEWEAIDKADYLNNYTITIHCIDGDITI